MAYTFTRKTDNVDKIMAVDVNELQAAIEDISTDVDTMSNINATFLLSAAGITPAATNGCADPEKKTTSSNLLNYKVAAFDKDTVEIGWWNHPLPSDYNGGTVIFRVFCEHMGSVGNALVAWDLAAVAITNGYSVDAAVGQAVQVNIPVFYSTALYCSAWSTPLTIAGTPTAGKMVYWRLRRVANDGTNDTLASDALLHYVEIKYTRA